MAPSLDLLQKLHLVLPWFIVYSLAILLLSCRSSIMNRANAILSITIHRYLLWKYPFRNEDGTRKIPTCLYRFPNGQGDAGKFLEGASNSARWRESHGSVYRIWSGLRPEIVLTSQEHLQLVFRDSDRHTKAFNNNSGWLMSQLLGRCVGLVNGEEWKVVREGVAHPFLRKSAASQIPLIQKHVSRHFDNLLHQGNLANGLLDPAEDLKMLPFWVVAEILYGDLSPDMIQDLERLVPLREELFRHVIRGGMTRFGFSRYIPSRLNRLLRAFMVEWKSFNDKACARARSFDPPAQIVHFHDQVAKGSITSDNLLHTLDESLFANLDVTIGGISWNVVFLAAHKEYQNRLKDELAAHSKDDTEYQMYILKNSTLLAACVSESSRLRPLAAFSVPQSAPTPRVIDGYVIPAGTDFIIDTHKLNIQSKVWGADGTVYRPERFLGGEALERRYSFWRFGFGPRQCLGKHLADAIIRTLIAHLVQNYEMGIPDGLEWESNPNSWISHPEMRIQCIRRGV